MIGDRHMIRSGWRWDVFAYFPCNAGGVRVAVRTTEERAKRFAVLFSKRNGVPMMYRIRHDPGLDKTKGGRRHAEDRTDRVAAARNHHHHRSRG